MTIQSDGHRAAGHGAERSVERCGQRQPLEAAERRHDGTADDELSGEASEGRQAVAVVPQADDRERDGAKHERQGAVSGLAGPAAGQTERDQHRDDDRRASPARHHVLVRRARVRPVEQAPAPRGGAERRRQREREDERDGHRPDRHVVMIRDEAIVRSRAR